MTEGLDRLPTPFLSDVLWLLTTGAETRHAAPHAVMLGVATAALYDLEHIGEVTWSGSGEAASLHVRPQCRCEDETLRRWHLALIQTADGECLPARLTLSSLARTAWRDTAERLVATKGMPVMSKPRGPKGRLAFLVREQAALIAARRDLVKALEGGNTDDRQHALVVLAWASNCFDDLFHPHGWEAATTLLDAARSESEEDATYGRMSAACALSGWIASS